MSKIRLLSEGIPDLLPMQGRSSGPGVVHVSEIIHSLAVKLGHLKDDNGPAGSRAPDLTWMQLGSALETAIINRYEQQYPGRYFQPGEIMKDGLAGTPDLIDKRDWAVEEIKLAWMSSNHEPDSDKFWRYWVQVRAYCWLVETQVARLHVCHVNGDYRGGGPKYRVWEQRFTHQELLENWRMLKSHGGLK